MSLLKLFKRKPEPIIFYTAPFKPYVDPNRKLNGKTITCIHETIHCCAAMARIIYEHPWEYFTCVLGPDKKHVDHYIHIVNGRGYGPTIPCPFCGRDKPDEKA